MSTRAFQASKLIKAAIRIIRFRTKSLTIYLLRKLPIFQFENRRSPPPNDVFENFKDFTGHYQVVDCEHHRQPADATDQLCSLQVADLFFGDNYQPGADPAAFFIALSYRPDKPNARVGIALAQRDREAGDICSTFPGTQFCNSPKYSDIEDVSFKAGNGLIYLHYVRVFPPRRNEAYFFDSLDLTLKKLPE